ncbi:hypothetical protein GCM10009863_03500 [Streptomyces axinellae]|uniref:Uncharacterized protein n=1 Tax=Streptomyces axinellae TaxID=552788 RepID=A0ABP6BYE0_9ACTN
MQPKTQRRGRVTTAPAPSGDRTPRGGPLSHQNRARTMSTQLLERPAPLPLPVPADGPTAALAGNTATTEAAMPYRVGAPAIQCRYPVPSAKTRSSAAPTAGTETGSSMERLGIRRQKHRHRPAAMPCHRLNGLHERLERAWFCSMYFGSSAEPPKARLGGRPAVSVPLRQHATIGPSRDRKLPGRRRSTPGGYAVRRAGTGRAVAAVSDEKGSLGDGHCRSCDVDRVNLLAVAVGGGVHE